MQTPKKFSSFSDQVSWISDEKGIKIKDREYAEEMLRQIGYFPLMGGYKHLFRISNTKKYKAGTSFEEIVSLYKFDAELRELLGILQEKGNMLREPYSKHLDDGIFELRCKFGSDITRVLYFFYYEGKIILTNGFVKKTQKTPKEEIQIAKDRRKDFIERVMKDENI